jgi:inhibitor of growth protein 3
MAPATRVIDNGAAALDTAYTLTLLGEYAYTLDGLPAELARHFADLRELDAVLAGSMAAITAKVQRLTALIEVGNVGDALAVAARKAERLRLLGDLAAEAERVKPGSEDKIRVAGLCADALKASSLHMAAVLDAVPGRDYDAAVLSRDTVYPHVDPEGSSGYTHWKQHHKRHTAAYGHVIIDSPTKKRRLYGQEDELNALTRSPRKDKTAARNGARGKK